MNIYAAKLDAGVPKCVTQLLERVTSFTHWGRRGEECDNSTMRQFDNGRMECWNGGRMERNLPGLQNL
jgi:hypothetical protein